MVDLAEFVGDIPERRRLIRQIEKTQERLDKMMAKVTPLQADLAMYQEMIAAIDKRMALCPVAADDQDAPELEETETFKLALKIEGNHEDAGYTNDDFQRAEEEKPTNIADANAIPAFLRKSAL